MLFKSPILIDLSVIPDDQLKTHGHVALLETVQKHIKTRDLLSLAYQICEIANQISIDQYLFTATLEYIIDQTDRADYKSFFEILTRQLTEHRSNTMNIAERLRQEGRNEVIQETITIAERSRQEGREQGLYQGMQQVARNLLQKGLPVELVAETTELDLQVVLTLKKAMLH